MSGHIPSERESKYQEFYKSFVNGFFPSKSKSECQRLATEKWKEIRQAKNFEAKYSQVLTENSMLKPIPRIIQ